MQLLKKGAEAEIWLKHDGRVIKKRVRKGYRVIQLDRKLREKRTRFETRLMDRARNVGVNVPRIIRQSKYSFEMEFVDGVQLKNVLNKDNYQKFGKKVGEMLAKLHAHNIIHGDFTTSNIMVRDDETYLMDFGLGFISASIEDKATDLHVFEETTKATHPEIFEDFVKLVLEEYRKSIGSEGERILSRLERIRKRGRYVQKT